MLSNGLWRFLGEIDCGYFTVSNSDDMTFDFSLFVNSFYHRYIIDLFLFHFN